VASEISDTERRRIRAAASLIEANPLVCRVAGVDPSVVARIRLAFD